MDSKKIDRLLQRFVEIGPKGCGAIVTHHGKIVYEGYAGYADAELGKPADRSTLYRIYSCSKVFTVIAVMQLFERGHFLINDPIEWYLPEFKNPQVYVTTGNGVRTVVPAKSSITIRDLLAMSSGLTYEGANNPTECDITALIAELEKKGSYTIREFVRGLAQIPLAFHPGTGFFYSYSHDVLTALVEEVSGKTYGKYLKENILEPLCMEHTSLFVEGEERKHLSRLYTWDEKHELIPDNSRDYMFYKEHKLELGGAGILSTVLDMSKFAAVLSMGGTLDGVKIISRKTVDLIRRNQLVGEAMKDFEEACNNNWDFLKGYGYGLGVRTLLHPEKGGINGTIGEFGWAGMAGTYILIDPEEELSICYGHQIAPDNMEGYCHPRLKAVVYGNLD